MIHITGCLTPLVCVRCGLSETVVRKQNIKESVKNVAQGLLVSDDVMFVRGERWRQTRIG